LNKNTKNNSGISGSHKWIDQLIDKHKGEAGFVIGNGWTSKYYDTAKMKKEGVLIGCNHGFLNHPLDYLIWQDNNVNSDCMKAECTKICLMRKKRFHEIQPPNTYYFGFGRRTILGALLHNSSGGSALQLLHWMGCNPIILVGCDCALIERNELKELKGNVFGDKQAKLFNGSRGRKIIVNGREVKTTKRLLDFVREFEHWANVLSPKTKVYKMGDFGAVDIPYVDFPELWTDKHPDYGKRQSE
jgi:hypothetical protein